MRLIDADELPVITLTDGGYWQKEVVYKADIDATPTITPESLVRHGQWIPFYESEVSGWNPEFAGYDPIAGYKCSECGEEAILDCNDKFVLSNYCPNCGAKMDL